MAGELIEVLQQSDLLTNLPREVLGPLAETAVTEEHADSQPRSAAALARTDVVLVGVTRPTSSACSRTPRVR